VENNQIHFFLSTIKDDPRNLEKCIEVLYMLQSTRGPVAEVTTILKYKTPLLYFLLKKRVNHNLGLKMLFDVVFHYDVAEKSLQLHYNAWNKISVSIG
jgi:hypothetical protein